MKRQKYSFNITKWILFSSNELEKIPITWLLVYILVIDVISITCFAKSDYNGLVISILMRSGCYCLTGQFQEHQWIQQGAWGLQLYIANTIAYGYTFWHQLLGLYPVHGCTILSGSQTSRCVRSPRVALF